MAGYDHQAIEAKWRKAWEKKKTWKVNLDRAKKPYYNLMMFPYPSAEGLHVGNVYAFTGSDIHGRFQRMRGYDVFEPMGFDSFGIHSENFAIKKGKHPKEQTAKNIQHFTEQLKQLGALFDWDRAVTTSDPSYYKWTQWLFVQLYKAGLAYKAKAPVDWCPSCKTVLADEQVIEGKCERCDSVVAQKDLEQWFFAITKYAERLLKNLEWIDWTEKTKLAQKNWIGRSEDVEIEFVLKGLELKLRVVTTRPDTLFGVTFMVLAPEHPLLNELKDSITNWKEVEQYRKIATEKTEFERGLATKEKTGIKLEGIVAVNPVNSEEVPVYIADYVLAGYGTGAIMAVPGHDDRDYVFAKQYGLPLKIVVERPREAKTFSVFLYDHDDSRAAEELRKRGTPAEYWTPTQRKYDFEFKNVQRVINLLQKNGIGNEAEYQHIQQGQSFALENKEKEIDFGLVYAGDGKHINSEFLNGLDNKAAIKKITSLLEKKKIGEQSVHYHLRDWLISRQRYWGPPIPIIYCKDCGTLPVPEKDLPIRLPEVKNFRPTGTGKSPLASVASFVKTKCPECKGPAERETDVSDTFLDSAWYFFRYSSTEFNKKPFDKKRMKKWLPVDMYIGGHEHAVLHLLYTRFITMALRDMGHIDFEEPFKKFRAHGLITKGGAKMSKSKGNVVNPDDYFQKYGADTVRTYLMFLGPLSEGGDWSDQGIVGISRFFNRLWKFVEARKGKTFSPNKEMETLRHLTIKKATQDLEALRYNTAIASLMEYFNALSQAEKATKDQINTLLILLSPFAPHLAEELWERMGNKGSVHEQAWPKHNPKALVEKEVRLVVQVNGKVRDTLMAPSDISKEEAVQLALKQPKIAKWLEGKEPAKTVVVPGRLISFVI